MWSAPSGDSTESLVSEVSDIYTRDFKSSKSQRYSPPPGYDGIAFAPQSEYPQTDYQRDRTAGPTVRYVAKNEARDEENGADIPDVTDIPEEEEYAGEEYREDDIPSPGEEAEAEQSAELGIGEKNYSHMSLRENDAVFKLIESLHGKFGREELIILLVMFLVASDGICAEVLILALLLIAG